MKINWQIEKQQFICLCKFIALLGLVLFILFLAALVGEALHNLDYSTDIWMGM